MQKETRREKKREKESIKAFTLPSKERVEGGEGEDSRAERAKGCDNEQEELERRMKRERERERDRLGIRTQRCRERGNKRTDAPARFDFIR